MSHKDQQWMRHALRLALMAEGKTAPNPMVGAVLVYEDQIIGEGWHHQAGTPHAEVHCIQSVQDEHLSFIPESTLYVTLEPCSHFGKTPPCADLIITSGIRRVVIGCRDSFAQVDGRGIAKLRDAGIEVVVDVEEQQAKWLNRVFFTFHQYKRPYIILKWAQTSDRIIGTRTGERLLISNPLTNRWVHDLRSKHQAIVVGAHTVLDDDPLLDTRLIQDEQPPIKIILDRSGIVPEKSRIFHQGNKCVIFTQNKNLVDRFKYNERVSVVYKDSDLDMSSILNRLYEMDILSIVVEGGAQVLNQWILDGLWDEAFVITSPKTYGLDGIMAPKVINGKLYRNFHIGDDRIEHFIYIDNEFYL